MLRYVAAGFVLFNLFNKAKNAVLDKITFAMLKPRKSDFNLLRERLNLRIKVTNGMGVQIPVSAVKGKLIQNENVIGSFTTSQINDIPANSTKEIALDGKIESENVLLQIAQAILSFANNGARPNLDPIIFKGHVFVDDKVFPVEKVYRLF